MTPLVVIVPSRGRPERALEAVEALRRTAVGISTSIVLAVDADDPRLDGYRARFTDGRYAPEVALMVLTGEETGDLVRATNTPAMRIARTEPDAIVGVINDDQVARTTGWDVRIRRALTTPGIAYGDDLFQHHALVTCPFISASIVLALGWYAAPFLRHLFIDNVWRDLGADLGVLRYLPDLVFEHLHPFAGKAEWDATYERGNAQDIVDRDRIAYEAWRDGGGREVDVARVRRALAVAA